VVALAGYSDASGSQADNHMLVVAGLVGELDDWNSFDRQWLERLKSEGIEAFRMADFAHFWGDFREGWEGDEPRRIAFIQTLVRLTNETAYKAFVKAVNLADYRALDRAYKLTESFGGPYAIAQAQCLIAAFEWMQSDLKARGEVKSPVKFFVEEGDMGQDAFRALLREQIHVFEPYVSIVPKQPAGEEVTPFHACDLIAYEHRLLYERVVTGATHTWRQSLKEIRATLSPKPTIVDHDALTRMIEKDSVPKRAS